MKQIKTLPDLDTFQTSLKGQTVALVPTMGALHDGHLALVKEGMKQADICLPYIFLNPTQFAEGEDLDQYPQTLESDLKILEELGVQYVWLPQSKDIYPNGLQISHQATASTKFLEGEHRPHFFDGVVTVLHRMFSLSIPNKVMMGEKDFQQLQVTRAMAAEYFPDIQIIGVSTIRDENGLALSSRNIYLSAEDYQIAIQLNKILKSLAQSEMTETQAKKELIRVGFDKVDYITMRNSQTFETENPDRVLAAAWIGKTRLIDNKAMIP